MGVNAICKSGGCGELCAFCMARREMQGRQGVEKTRVAAWGKEQQQSLSYSYSSMGGCAIGDCLVAGRANQNERWAVQ